LSSSGTERSGGRGAAGDARPAVSMVVVYVHGLWLPGHEGFLLRRRVGRALGAETRSFSYASVGCGLDENALALKQYLRTIQADTVHLVAHSLGGLVVLKLFEPGVVAGDLGFAPGRIVFLGSPVRGSRSAQRFARLPFGRRLLGLTAADTLLVSRERRWSGARDLGVIAGDMSVGAGRLLGPMGAPNDGTVLVEETDLPGAAQQLRMRVNHSGMPFSALVARQTAAFLREGQFAG
jgi:pimeloyl-ACP methyl ester carboxylesterase